MPGSLWGKKIFGLPMGRLDFTIRILLLVRLHRLKAVEITSYTTIKEFGKNCKFLSVIIGIDAASRPT